MAKNSSTKGAKKGRRFKRPRSDVAKALCAQRKAARRKAQEEAHKANVARGYTLWDAARVRRNLARH